MLRQIPDPTVARLSIYTRCLADLVDKEIDVVSSEELAEFAGVNAAQVRKDLSYLGSLGRRGVGYDTRHLHNRLSQKLGLTRERSIVIVGAGKLGSALLAYRGFRARGFKPVAAFDANKKKVNTFIDGIKIYDPSRIKEVVKKKKADIGIIAVPASQAQEVVDELISAGVRSILNFAPVVLKIPPGIVFRQVDLSLELEAISYYLSNRGG